MTENGSSNQTDRTWRFDVTLAGDVDLDILMYGLPENFPPEHELLAEKLAIRLGGSSAITAHNLAALGNSVGLITAAAEDEFGSLCRTELSRAGVDLSRSVRARDAQTGVTVHLQHAVRRHMFTHAGATFHLQFDDLDLGYLSDARHFHMSSYYLQRALTPRIPELFAKLKQAGVTLSLDPNDDPDQTWDRRILEALRYVDVLLPNEREACLIANEPSLDSAITKLRGLVPLLVVKCGVNGASAYAGVRSWQAPAHKVQVADAIGAGDSFNAGFLHAWLRGWPVDRALAYANLTGAWSTTASGGTGAFKHPEALRTLATTWEQECAAIAK
jgi:sugar/nucleoside kinase (ribokinase family)